VNGILAFVDILVDTKQMERAVASLKELPNAKEVYQVTGNGCNIVSIVAASDIDEFRDILKNQIMKINGVREIITSLSLANHKRLSPDHFQ
jgi:DNA-binding Lrp family transcriptional regulator